MSTRPLEDVLAVYIANLFDLPAARGLEIAHALLTDLTSPLRPMLDAHADAIALAKRVIEYFGDEPDSAMKRVEVELRDMAKAFLTKVEAKP